MSSATNNINQQQAMEQFNATDDPVLLGHCLHHLLSRAVKDHAEKTAIICGNTSLTYGQLDTQASFLAYTLISRGLGPGDIIGIALGRSVKLVVALLAVLKSGAAYTPIDPTFPADRIGHMTDDAEPRLVIVEASTQEVMNSTWSGECLDVDADITNENVPEGAIQLAQEGRREVQPDDLAYVIYTSGSTGKPKGVEISHGALSNHLLAVGRELGCTAADKLLAVTTISFDIAALELFLPLLHGATVVVAQTHQVKDPTALIALMNRHAITMMQATPTTWTMLLEAGWQGDEADKMHRLDTLLCGGEGMPQRLADRLLPCADAVWNMYGPTEATVWASMWRVEAGEKVAIGRPIANYKLYVLMEDLSPAPLGGEAELYIGGQSLARGYHKKPELTRERFIENPFPEGGRLYRTGDIARFESSGRLMVTGRADGMIKIRGYRIDVGDIEAAITAHPGISEAVVVGKGDRLIAHCLRARDVHIQGTEPALDRMLRPWLEERLPSYMIPAFFVETTSFPTTLNNKIDRKALPGPTEAKGPVAAAAMPRNEMEASIRTIWSQVLECSPDCISIRDNFFHIGGNSVRLIQAQKLVEKLLGRPLSVATMFQHYTIQTLAAHLSSDQDPKPDNTPTDRPDPWPQGTRDDHNGDIAVVSMACRLPGGITTPEEYWELLERGGDATSDVPENRWDADAIYSADAEAAGKSYCRRGGFLDNVDGFDASFFGIPPREARAMDPAQRLMLETCWEGFERAGYTNSKLRGSQTGVYMGVCSFGAHGAPVPLSNLDGYAATGSALSTVSGRVSYTLGLEGPSFTIDAACASSLVTTHLACNALRTGECDMAISGGVSVLLGPGMHVEFSRLRGMSEDGRCRAFAADSQGVGWAEGCAVVVLKRLQDAVRNGDKIHAVIRGSAVNHVGRTVAGLTVPSVSAQQRLIQTALRRAAVGPDDLSYYEAHGTATKLGDPIEIEALAKVFESRSQPQPLWIGSVKSNIGHTQAAAGVASLLKVVLSIRANTLPRTLHAETPTPAIDWDNMNLALVQKPQPWSYQAGQPRCAGISSFGIGGTNACIVVEEPPSQRQDGTGLEASLPVSTTPRSLHLETPVLLSGHTSVALRRQAVKLREYLEGTSSEDTLTSNSQDGLGELAHALATTRSHFRWRQAILAKDKTDLLVQLKTASGASASAPFTTGISAANSAPEPRLAMLFTGQGSQVAGIGKDLYDAYLVFREALDNITSLFPDLERPLLQVMHADPETDPVTASLLHRTDFAQPALFALEVALWHLWTSWGVHADVVLGHSIGELAAAHVAGVFDLADACRLVAARGRLMQAVSLPGRMVSLEASASEVASAIAHLGLKNSIDIAGHNAPQQTVASGDADGIEAITAHFEQLGRRAKALDVSHAFHSHHMDGMLEPFRAVAKTIRFHAPRIPLVSTLTGTRAAPGELERSEYWVQQARSETRFVEGMQSLRNLCDANVFLELGPQPTLLGMGAACLSCENGANNDVAWLPSLPRAVAMKKPGAALLSMQRSLTELHVRGVPVDWDKYFAPWGFNHRHRVELPTYAFQQEKFDYPRPWALEMKNQHAGSDEDIRNTEIRIDGEREFRDSEHGERGLPASESQAMERDSLRQVLTKAVTSDERSRTMLALVQHTVAKALGFTRPEDVDMTLPFRDMGIDSLSALQIRNELARRTQLTLAVGLIFQHRDLTALGQFLLSQLEMQRHMTRAKDDTSSESGSDAESSSDTGSTPASSVIREGPVQLDTDAMMNGCLDPDLTFDNVAGHAPETEPPASVFLTGVTGFVGAFIARDLLDLGIQVYCLVRCADEKAAMQRLVETFTAYGFWKPSYKTLLHAIPGDMALPYLGLSTDVYYDLANHIEAICHSGAFVNWVRPLEDFIGPNVVSTHELLRLASCGRRKTMHLVSTVSTLPLHHGFEMTADNMEHGYATSKYTAERLVSAARWRGAEASVYRLPFVAASQETGHFRLDRGDFLHNVVAGSLLELGGAFPAMGPGADLYSVLPVDYISQTIVGAITRTGLKIGRDYDFANPDPLTFDEFFEFAAATAADTVDGAGAKTELLSFSCWRERVLAYAAEHRTGSLARIVGLLGDMVDETDAAAMFTCLPRGEYILGGNAPNMDKEYVTKYVEQIRAMGN
ncbi:hypothetical protein F4777DRAFT_598129 [Nemania sp. FL0916]|nr:hypothetical protein F4777DRAFT_598129 [Nemania sp. FL0916]